MEVLRVFVKHQSSRLLHQELRSQPNLCDIKKIKPEFIKIRLSRIHGLNISCLLNLIPLLDNLPEISLGVIRILTTHLHSFTVSELLLTVLCDEVVFDVDKLSVGVYLLEGVAAVAMVKAPPLGSSVIAEEHETCIVSFWGVGEEVEEGVVIEEEVCWFAGLRANDVWSLDGVAAEEDGLKWGQYGILRAQDELRKTNLEWTSIHIGFFLDFWGSSKSAAKSNLHTPSTFVDIKHRAAAIPGSGDVPVTFTYSRDVAKFVAALLNLDKWDEATYSIGDKVTFNELVKIAEEATGDKFKVVYDSVETLEKGELSELPGHEAMFANIPAPKAVMKKVMSAYGLLAESGGFNLDESKALNKDFPNIKPITVREFLEDAWGSPANILS
ncbi:isoflavone reductase like IRL [Fusarium subglutinans]|uniref:Isoflavone reductase like IRL n=1 Tax=Gibberella subglutinans TaxID=42677 RepID=A0A8H5QFK5_GIBSU|nr:isoflavone reductase like IRL [Fusarium subglutinans]KAF5613859.1 isoflavone reductase like IRL [Fusarium subglutinans]